jgi:asparagine synthase (glutamine-hydrolysing)
MCGIAVAINWDGAEAVVKSLVGGIWHRGDVSDPVMSPRPNTAMGTRRLRIVDGAHAMQPQISFDNRVLVAFNGEIYNHRALRRELEALGVAFHTESDTEVLASALSCWGPKALERLNGMYAFVAIDIGTGEFLAARDPLGVKPLYIIQSGAGFLFCSEIRPLLEAVETGDVLLLPPGHLLTPNTCMPFRSFAAAPDRPTQSFEARTLDAILAEAVHTRLPPDLPVATLFSGGIDSTLIAHYARQVRPDTPGYFLGGAEAPDYRYAAEYADLTGMDLRHVPLDSQTPTLDLIDAMVETVETFEPNVLRDSLCTYLLSRRIHDDGYRVALCGEGADELFAGYAPLELAFDDGEAAGCFVRDQCLGGMHRTNLQRLDRTSMRFQLEAREPFLDPSVVDYALSLSGRDLVRESAGAPQGKAPLRALYDLYPHALPASIRGRRKLPLNEGAGLDAGPKDSPWIAFAEATISDQDLIDNQQRFAAFDLRTKEEALYVLRLAETMDVSRVPHLKARTRLHFPTVKNMHLLESYII